MTDVDRRGKAPETSQTLSNTVKPYIPGKSIGYPSGPKAESSRAEGKRPALTWPDSVDSHSGSSNAEPSTSSSANPGKEKHQATVENYFDTEAGQFDKNAELNEADCTGDVPMAGDEPPSPTNTEDYREERERLREGQMNFIDTTATGESRVPAEIRKQWKRAYPVARSWWSHSHNEEAKNLIESVNDEIRKYNVPRKEEGREPNMDLFPQTHVISFIDLTKKKLSEVKAAQYNAPVYAARVKELVDIVTPLTLQFSRWGVNVKELIPDEYKTTLGHLLLNEASELQSKQILSELLKPIDEQKEILTQASGPMVKFFDNIKSQTHTMDAISELSVINAKLSNVNTESGLAVDDHHIPVEEMMQIASRCTNIAEPKRNQDYLKAIENFKWMLIDRGFPAENWILCEGHYNPEQMKARLVPASLDKSLLCLDQSNEAGIRQSLNIAPWTPSQSAAGGSFFPASTVGSMPLAQAPAQMHAQMPAQMLAHTPAPRPAQVSAQMLAQTPAKTHMPVREVSGSLFVEPEPDYQSLEHDILDALNISYQATAIDQGITHQGKVVWVRKYGTGYRVFVNCGTDKIPLYAVCPDGLLGRDSGRLLWEKFGGTDETIDPKKRRITHLNKVLNMVEIPRSPNAKNKRQPDTYVQVEWKNSPANPFYRQHPLKEWITISDYRYFAGNKMAEQVRKMFREKNQRIEKYLLMHKERKLHPETRRALTEHDREQSPWLFL